MTGGDARLLKKIAFRDMPGNDNCLRQSKQRSASLWLTQYRRSGSRQGQKVSTDDRGPAIEWIEMLGPLLSCEFLVGRNHPQRVPQVG
jgi:hypothetical protein